MIDHKLNFNLHVSNICRSAARQLNVLKRLHNVLDQKSKLAIYKSFILSNFNYCSVVWHFCGVANSKKIEKIQERALRFVYKDFSSSYNDLLEKGDHSMLYIKRLRYMAVEVYKSLHDIGPDYLKSLLKVNECRYDLRSIKPLIQPKCNTVTYGLNSYSYKGPKIWNGLPNDIKSAITLDEFKDLIKTWNGPTCYCVMCTSLTKG